MTETPSQPLSGGSLRSPRQRSRKTRLGPSSGKRQSKSLHSPSKPQGPYQLVGQDRTLGKVASSIECVMPYVFNIELLGDQGTTRNNQVYSKRWVGQRGWATIPTVLPDSGDVTHHPFQHEVNHFVECILSDRESHANVEDAALTHEICFASEISAREGRPISLPL